MHDEKKIEHKDAYDAEGGIFLLSISSYPQERGEHPLIKALMWSNSVGQAHNPPNHPIYQHS